jgi:hypothetical protein
MSAAQASRPKLAGILGMLGSEHDGEVLAAARMAERLRREMGATWHDLIACPPEPETSRRSDPPRPSRPQAPHWRATVARCRARPDRLSDFERRFLASLAGFRTLSPKQATVLVGIAERLDAEDAG